MYLLPEGFERRADIFDVLHQKMITGGIVRGLVQAIDYPDETPTWIVSFPDIDINRQVRGLVPEPETGMDHALMIRFIQQMVNLKILGIDQDNCLVVCSRQAAVAELSEHLNLQEGQLLECSVRAFKPNPDGRQPFLSVDIGGGILVDIPYLDARISYTKPLREQYQIGQIVTAKVITIDNNHPLLSLRAVRPNPWKNASFRRGQIIAGTVQRVDNNLVFIEPDLYPGILGISSLPVWGTIRKRQKVKCNVTNFLPEEGKLHLRIRPV
jgi:small subunit ribosomal protein S1